MVFKNNFRQSHLLVNLLSSGKVHPFSMVSGPNQQTNIDKQGMLSLGYENSNHSMIGGFNLLKITSH